MTLRSPPTGPTPSASSACCASPTRADATFDATLEAIAGDFAWSVAFDSDSVSLAAGDTATVAAVVTVAPDAWADNAVLVTARAAAADGMQTTSFRVVPDREAPALNPVAVDPLPPELLGGLDVAWTGLGATVVAPDDAAVAEESLLHDGSDAAGSRVVGRRGAAPARVDRRPRR